MTKHGFRSRPAGDSSTARFAPAAWFRALFQPATRRCALTRPWLCHESRRL